jgi:hypothetical protein
MREKYPDSISTVPFTYASIKVWDFCRTPPRTSYIIYGEGYLRFTDTR